jgi:hypothetical protein
VRRISEDVFVNEEEIVSIENYEKWEVSGSIFNERHYLDHKGVVIVMKNGRKIYIRDKTAVEVYAMVFQ